MLRGTFKQNATAKWSDDNKTVELIGAGNFQAGDYTVNVTGVSDNALTGTVTIAKQQVSSIEILSDVAVLSKNPNGLVTDETATVGYVVKDQYGTDITSTTTLTTNNTDTVKTDGKGKITLSGLQGKKIGDIVPVVLVHAETGTTASTTVKLSAAATVSDITVDGVYNAKGEKVELKDNTKASDSYLVVNVKDQYGNAIEPKNSLDKATGVIVTNTNPLVAKLASDKIETAVIDGKNKFVVKFSKLDATNEFKGGAAELLFITTMDGKTFKHTVNVAETTTTDAVSAGQPQFAISGEDVKLPITVMDKEGNVIVDRDLLSHSTKGIKVNGASVAKADLEVKDGQVYYNLGTATAAADAYQTATVTSSTNKVATVTFKVNKAANPVAVRGFKTPLVIKADSTKVVDASMLNIEDQYGRTIKTLPSGFGVAVENIAADANQVVTVTDNKTIDPKGQNGTATVAIYLTKDGEKVANSTVEQQVRVTNGKEYSNYEVLPVGQVEVNADGVTGKEFTVNGLLDNGKVALDTDEYTATVSGDAVASVLADNKTISVTKLNDTDATTAELTLKVTVNATGQVIEQKFIASTAVKTVQDFFFTSTAAGDNFDDAKAITEAIVKGGTYTLAKQIDVDGTPKDQNVAHVDQYGNDYVTNASTLTGKNEAKVTIVPDKASDVTITGNGTKGAAAALTANVDESKVTVKVKIGDVTKELKVTIKKAD